MDSVITIEQNIVKFLDTQGKEVETHSMSASDIQSIHIDDRTVSKFFGLKKINTKGIMIEAQGVNKRLEIFESSVGEKEFTSYVDQLTKFAKDHRIAFRNTVGE